MRNILPDQLDAAARLVRGRPKPMGMLEGLDSTFDAALCVGYHARAGALGVLSHSFMGHEIEDMWLDDRPTGEIGLTHAAAAALGVPVVVLTGDDAACAEAADWDRSVRTVTVKQARDRFAAELLPVPEARQEIEKTAAAALQAASGETATTGRLTLVQDTPRAAAPPRDPAAPATLAVRWQSASVASMLLGIPGVTRRDSRTVVATAPAPALFRLLGVWISVAAALTGQRPYC
jgi:D-amino peptidase